MSEETTPTVEATTDAPKKRRGRPPVKPPRVDVIERSVQTEWDTLLEEIVRKREADPFGSTSRPIRLTKPELVPHWINRDKYPDAIPQAKEKGWRGVTLDMIADKDQLGEYSISPDGFVVRGERGNELLMCMPEEYVRRIAIAKSFANEQRMKNPNTVRRDAIEAFGRMNPDGAEMVNRQGDVQHVGRVTTTRERILVTPDTD